MAKNRLLVVLALIWLGTYAGSFLAFALTESTDFGFTRGLNRITTFLTWQMVAGVIAIILWLAGRRQPPGSPLRWLARVPAFLALLLVLAIIAVIAWARFSKPAPQPAPTVPPKVTAPVTDG